KGPSPPQGRRLPGGPRRDANSPEGPHHRRDAPSRRNPPQGHQLLGGTPTTTGTPPPGGTLAPQGPHPRRTESCGRRSGNRGRRDQGAPEPSAVTTTAAGPWVRAEVKGWGPGPGTAPGTGADGGGGECGWGGAEGGGLCAGDG